MRGVQGAPPDRWPLPDRHDPGRAHPRAARSVGEGHVPLRSARHPGAHGLAGACPDHGRARERASDRPQPGRGARLPARGRSSRSLSQAAPRRLRDQRGGGAGASPAAGHHRCDDGALRVLPFVLGGRHRRLRARARDADSRTPERGGGHLSGAQALRHRRGRARVLSHPRGSGRGARRQRRAGGGTVHPDPRAAGAGPPRLPLDGARARRHAGGLRSLPRVTRGAGLTRAEEVVVLGWMQAVVLGLVEGITEYLPVGSTGHLILAASLLGLENPDTHAALDTYLVVVQGGAILAVVGLYFPRVRSMVMGLLGRDEAGRRLVGLLLVAFAPAAVGGLLLGNTIDRLLFHPLPVLFALAVGGVFMIALGARSTGARSASGTIDAMAWTTALGIGCWQTLALWPGTSRSMVTIAGGILLGMHTAEAAEFSFLLGLPTLGAACVFKLRHGIVAGPHGEPPMLAQLGGAAVTIGIVVAAVSAAVAVRWFVRLLTRRGLAPFGWYRLALTALLSALMLAGVVELRG